jgi:hypothetical protein
VLDVDDVGKLRCHAPRELLESDHAAVSVVGGGSLHRLLDVVPATLGRAKRVGEGDVVTMREERLNGVRVTLEEGIERAM